MNYQLPASADRRNKKILRFTLIELIVSMTIIAVLTVVAIVSFTGMNKKARDSKRASDMQKVAIALEMARQVGSTYPAADNNKLPTGLVPNYLQALPIDPKGYSYEYTSTDYTYSYSGSMEDLGSTNIASFGSCGGLGCNYQITNP